MTAVAPVVETSLSNLKLLRRGKVRDVYEVDADRLLIVATDRISAFDSVSPTPIERKAETGHDENISEQQMAEIVGEDVMKTLRDVSLRLYTEASDYARTRGIIIADTKFEFGRDQNGEITLIDEVLTPDSSRFWPVDS